MANDDADFTVRMINEVTRPARDATRSIREVQSAFSGLERLAAGAAAAGLALIATAAAAAAVGVGFLAAKFAGAALEGARFAQNSELALKFLMGSAGAAAASFDEVRHEAEELGLNVQEAVGGFTKLIAAQFEAGQARELLRMSADLQVITGNAESAQRAILAITQIKSKGRVQAEELLQLQEAGVSGELVFQALEKQLGKTRDEVRKLMEAGKLDADTGIGAIMAAIKKKTGVEEFGDVGRASATETLDGMKRVFDAKVANLFIDVGKKIMPVIGPIADQIFGLFDKILASPALAQLGTFLLNEFEMFGLWIDANWPEIEATIISGVEFIAAVIKGSFAVMGFFVEHWDIIRLALLGVALVLGIVSVATLMLSSLALIAIGVIALVIGAVAAFIGYVIGNFGTILTAIGETFTAVFAFLLSIGPTFFEFGVSLVQGLINGITSMVGLAISAVTGLGGGVIAAFRRILGIASPSKVFAEMGGFTVEGFTGGIAANDTTVQGATADMASSALSGVDGGSGEQASGGGGAGGITINVVVNGAGKGGQELGDEIAAKVRREVQAIFEAA